MSLRDALEDAAYMAAWEPEDGGLVVGAVAVPDLCLDVLAKADDAMLAEAGLFRAARYETAVRIGMPDGPLIDHAPAEKATHRRAVGAWTPVKEDDGG